MKNWEKFSGTGILAYVGIPIYAMHSAMETAGMKDQYDLEAFMKAFYKEL